MESTSTLLTGDNSWQPSLMWLSCVTTPRIRAALTQVLVIRNEHVLPVHVKQRLLPQWHRNVQLWRRKSSRVNGVAPTEICKLPLQALKPFSTRFQPVLIWDAAKTHLQPDVLRCGGNFGICLIIVPAKITWLLQQTDTHCFARYSAFFR